MKQRWTGRRGDLLSGVSRSTLIRFGTESPVAPRLRNGATGTGKSVTTRKASKSAKSRKSQNTKRHRSAMEPLEQRILLNADLTGGAAVVYDAGM